MNTAFILIIRDLAIQEALSGKDMSTIVGGQYRQPASSSSKPKAATTEAYLILDLSAPFISSY